jgi:cadmium resistance protein CadD (predicted permease)
MDVLGLIMGVVVLGLGIWYLYMGWQGKGIVLKRSEEEKSEEEQAKKVKQITSRYKVIGTIALIVGIAAILLSTLWTP